MYCICSQNTLHVKVLPQSYSLIKFQAFKDDKTKEILKNATPEQMEKGLIEKTLRKLHPDIRSKLDEIKRNIINEYKQKLRKAKMDDKIPDEMYQFQDADLIHLIKEVRSS